MNSADRLLEEYKTAELPEERERVTNQLLERCESDPDALKALLHVLNSEGDPDIRLAIVRFLESRRPPAAVRALVKAMFDPDAVVRGHAAVAVAGYNDPRILSWSLSELLDAVPDPVTRVPAERAIAAVSGRPSSKISRSERERIRRGEHPESVWPDYYRGLPPTDPS